MTAPKKQEKSLAAFKQIYDPNVRVPSAIRAVLEVMIKEDGLEAWDYETAVAKRAGISTTQMGLFREEFDKHILSVKEPGRSEKRVWFADAKVAAKARGT